MDQDREFAERMAELDGSYESPYPWEESRAVFSSTIQGGTGGRDQYVKWRTGVFKIEKPGGGDEPGE